MKKNKLEEQELVNKGYSPELAMAMARKSENRAKWLKKGHKKLKDKY